MMGFELINPLLPGYDRHAINPLNLGFLVCEVGPMIDPTSRGCFEKKMK